MKTSFSHFQCLSIFIKCDCCRSFALHFSAFRFSLNLMEFSALGAFGNNFGEFGMHCSDCVTCSDCIFSHDDSTYTHIPYTFGGAIFVTFHDG